MGPMALVFGFNSLLYQAIFPPPAGPYLMAGVYVRGNGSFGKYKQIIQLKVNINGAIEGFPQVG